MCQFEIKVQKGSSSASVFPWSIGHIMGQGSPLGLLRAQCPAHTL